MVLSKDAACQGAWTGCPNHVLLPGTSHHSVWAEIEVSAGPWSRQLVPGHAMSVWGQTYTNTHTHTQTQTCWHTQTQTLLWKGELEPFRWL